MCLGIYYKDIKFSTHKNVIEEFFKSFFLKNWILFQSFSHNNHIVATNKYKGRIRNLYRYIQKKRRCKKA